jgi:hypothetical protein
MEGKPRRATGPAKGEQPATAVPDSRNDGTPVPAALAGRPALPVRGRGVGSTGLGHGREVGRRKPLKTVRVRVPGRCRRLGNEPRRGWRGPDERSGVRVTSPSVPRPEPRVGQRQEGNAAREGSSGRPPPVARRREASAAGGSTLAQRAGNPASRGKRTEERVSREEQSSGGRGTPRTRPAETCRGDRERSNPSGPYKRRRRNGAAGGTAVAPASPWEWAERHHARGAGGGLFRLGCVEGASRQPQERRSLALVRFRSSTKRARAVGGGQVSRKGPEGQGSAERFS